VNHLVFWDASAFVAIGNRRDVLHAPAVTLSKRLAHEQAYVLTDCISFVIMQDYGVTEAFTADRHFEQAGFIRLLHP
jgi:predicted nucleic acid-binding protein